MQVRTPPRQTTDRIRSQARHVLASNYDNP